jgi:hypothetical protein
MPERLAADTAAVSVNNREVVAVLHAQNDVFIPGIPLARVSRQMLVGFRIPAAGQANHAGLLRGAAAGLIGNAGVIRGDKPTLPVLILSRVLPICWKINRQGEIDLPEG